MLSDGHITRRGVYSHTTKYEEYANFLSDKFKLHGVHTNINFDHRFDKRTGKYYSRFMLKTLSIFKEHRRIWYPEEIKIVPEGLELNDEMLTHLILGDGSCSHGDSSFIISTEAFDDESKNRLLNYLTCYGITCWIIRTGNVHISRCDQNKIIFRKFVESCTVPSCYSYKISGIRDWSR